MTSASTPPIGSCSAPPMIGPPYKPKGWFVKVHGIKIYGNGPQDATKALLIIYDVFGFSSQILQGADFLAAQGYKVFMPDLLEGRPAPMEWMPMPDATGREPPANDRALDEFCQGPGNTQSTIGKVLQITQISQASNPQITKWGLVGYGWGGYVANCLLAAGSPFEACAQLQPGWPGQEVAERVAKPILALCSKDEPESDYAHFKPYLKVDAKFVHFPKMIHGWMSARGDLYRPEVQRDYQRGYEIVAEWFMRYL
ncbi:AIM2 family [Lecanosticta acicola]|uniref:AIM2 family n=1 Tax=Lecanosticta acicola TaxID=111012 RepID=A0AAI8Z4U5_9PEZI|nr:AIM2 family [Lecanosticta acicola]